MKVKEILDISAGLAKILNADLPIAMAWELKGFAASVRSQIEKINEMSKDLVKKYGEPHPKKPGSYILEEAKNPEAWALYQKDYTDFLELDVALPKVKKIPIAALSSAQLSALDCVNLEFLIDGDTVSSKTTHDGAS